MAAPNFDRAQWLAERRLHITATDIAAILGIHPYRSARIVWLDKRGELPEQEETDAMWLGTQLEQTIAEHFWRETGTRPERAGLCVHPTEPLFAATPDFYIGDDALLECKVAGQNSAQNFGEEGSDEIPSQYLCQAQWQMLVTGRKVCHLRVLMPHCMKVVPYTVAANPQLQNTMAHQARKWWNEYIVAGLAPPLSGADCDGKLVELKAPVSDGSVVTASPDIDDVCAELGNVRKDRQQLDEREAALTNQIKEFMGEAEVLESGQGRFKWSNQERQGIDTKRLKSEHPDIAEALAAKTFFRVFRTPFKSEKA